MKFLSDLTKHKQTFLDKKLTKSHKISLMIKLTGAKQANDLVSSQLDMCRQKFN